MKAQKKRQGAGRYAGPPKKAAKAGKGKKPRSSVCSKLVLAFVTLCNLTLSVVLYVLRRRDIIQAVDGDDEVKLLLTRPKETKTGEKPKT